MDFPLDFHKIVQGEVSDDKIRRVLRFGLSCELKKRSGDIEVEARALLDFVRELKKSPIAVETAAANSQHYEVPVEFFRLVLGKRLKYSCGYWPSTDTDLDASEEAMLELVCERACVADGQEILDLGCGWGSLSLYLAERLPGSRILGLSNARTQKAYIDAQIAARGIRNLEIETGDIVSWTTARRFDRVLSIEMFEHMRNYEALLAKIASWMKPEALLFVHIFTHLRHAYPFVGNWMADAFFTGGIMPSDNLLLYFQKDVRVLDHARVSGVHYQRTSEAWLSRLDERRDRVLEIFSREESADEALRAFVSWRLFFLTCAESFGYDGGQQWMVSHYLFGKAR
jgi:cyclopropane-fatty-acyl-phospholipid synthase